MSISTYQDLKMNREKEKRMEKKRATFMLLGISFFFFLLLLLDMTRPAYANGIGINYGMVGDNLPSPQDVVARIFHKSISGVTRAKLYSAEPAVLSAFRDSGVSLVVGVGNEHVASLKDPAAASAWMRENVSAFLPRTLVSAIAVGNEVFSVPSNDSCSAASQLMQDLLPAMKNLQAAAIDQGLDGRVKISTPHSLGVLSTSYPPSAGAFRPDIASDYIKPLLDFLSQTGAPFMVNAYPYFAYKSDPDHVPLEYALFQPNEGVADPSSGLQYSNLFDAQLDAVYSALETLGYPNLQLMVSETGWPSAGDSDELGASTENAQTYVSNLIQRLDSGHGTPLRPNLTFDTYVFALFNENLKPGPKSERNYGLFYPDGTVVYSLTSLGSSSSSNSSSSNPCSRTCSSVTNTNTTSTTYPNSNTNTTNNDDGNDDDGNNSSDEPNQSPSSMNIYPDDSSSHSLFIGTLVYCLSSLLAFSVLV